MNAMETDSQYGTTENACVRMILSGVNKRRHVVFSGLPSTPPTRPAGKFQPPRQRPRAGDEPPKIILFLGRAAVPASPAAAPRAPVGDAAPPGSRALQAVRDSQLGHRAVLLEISAAWRNKQAADQARRDIEWLGLPPLADWPLVDWPLAPRHMVPVGDRHQAHLPKLGFDSAERSCVLVHSPGYVHSQPLGFVPAAS